MIFPDSVAIDDDEPDYEPEPEPVTLEDLLELQELCMAELLTIEQFLGIAA
jgi:hypothetical protein